MKNLSLTFFCVLLSAATQVFAQCEKDISTHPLNPVNNEFLQLANEWDDTNGPYSVNSMLNSWSWFPPGNAVNFNLNLTNGWASDLPTTLNLTMNNAFFGAGSPTFIHAQANAYQDRDWKWEDGWELLHVGLGYYPNGEPVNTVQSNRVIDESVDVPYSRVVPYMIFYNRYRGTLRFFGNLFTELSNYSDVHIILQFEDIGSSGLSGVLRHLEPFDRALDQTTNVTMHESFNPNSGDNNRWFSADFQLGYDPCICGKNQEWKFTLNGVDTFNLDLIGRGLEVEVPIADGQGNPTYDGDWLDMNALPNGVDGGYQNKLNT